MGHPRVGANALDADAWLAELPRRERPQLPGGRAQRLRAQPQRERNHVLAADERDLAGGGRTPRHEPRVVPGAQPVPDRARASQRHRRVFHRGAQAPLGLAAIDLPSARGGRAQLGLGRIGEPLRATQDARRAGPRPRGEPAHEHDRLDTGVLRRGERLAEVADGGDLRGVQQ